MARPVHASAHTAAWIVLFTGALLVGLALNLGRPAARRLVATSVNRTLASVLLGRVTIDRIGSLGLTQIDDLDAHVDGPDGALVLRASGIHARIWTWVLLRHLVSRGTLLVDVPDVSVDRVDVAVDAQANGTPRIASAFALRAANPSDASHAGLRLHLRHLRAGRVTFHAQPTVAMDGSLDDLSAAVALIDGVLTIDVTHGRLSSSVPGLAAWIRGDVEGHLTTPELAMRARWSGDFGGIGESIDVRYEHDRIDAHLDVERATAAQVRAVWPSSPLSDPAELHAEVQGVLPHLDVSARGVLGTGTIEVAGAIELGADTHALLHLNAAAVDIHALVPSAPRSALAGAGEVDVVTKPSGDIEAKASVDLAGGDLGDSTIPKAFIVADARIPRGGLPTAHAEIRVLEPGAPGTLVLDAVSKGGAPVLTFQGDLRIPQIGKATRLAGLARGSAHLTTAGTLDFAAGTIAGHLSATLEDVAARGLSVSGARVEVGAGGKLAAPFFDVEIEGDRLEALPVRLSAFRASGRVGFDGGLAVRGLKVDVAADGPVLHASAPWVRVAADGWGFDDALIEGLGAPVSASLRSSIESLVVRAKTEGVELSAIAGFIGVPVGRGTAAVDLDATVRAGAAEGHVVLDVAHVALYGFKDVNARVTATVRGRRLAGSLSAGVDDLGTLEAATPALWVGPGRLLTASPWRKTWGDLHVASHVDLGRLAAKFPQFMQAGEELSGVVDIQGRLSRDSSDDETPGLDFTMRTRDLTFATHRFGATPVIFQGLNPSLEVTVDGRTGGTDLVAQMRDAKGPVATLHATSNAVPYGVIFSEANPVTALEAMPFEAELGLPPRVLETLPLALRPPGLAGELSGKVVWRGSIRTPSIDVQAGLKAGRSLTLANAVDLALNGKYDGARVTANLEATTRNHSVLEAAATLDVRASDVISGGAVPWTASGRVKLDRMPLRVLTFLSDHQVRGTASGEVALDGLHQDARVAGALTLDAFQVGDVSCKSVTAKLGFDGHALDAQVHADQSDGFLDGHAHVGARWGREMLPTVDTSAGGQAVVTAKNLRAALLLPFLGSSISALDGRIDADARVQMDPGASAIRPQGTVSLKSGTFELTRFGTEFHDARATVTLSPDGVVKLDDAMARGLTGSVAAAASARVDALGLSGARLTVQMPAKDPLPLVFDGIQMGALDGRFDLAADRAADGFNVTVNVPAAHVQLPTGTSSLDVQSLGDLEGVEVGVRSPRAEFVAMPLDRSREPPQDRAAERKRPIRVAVKLGTEVHVSRGAGLDVRLEGQPTITVTDETQVTGQIRMPAGGIIQVQGQRFEIENGSVTFDGRDPSDPQVVLTAGWSASDGTRVYADFVGPLRSAQVKLRSDPERSQTEILALLLSGQPEDAAAAAGGVATQELNNALGGVNRALDNLGLAGGISTKVDTSQVNPRPEVEVQIARDISLQVAWVIGAPPPGTNPDTAFLTLDWRFLRKWSLETTVGDAGTSIFDVVWQHRY